MTTASEGLIQHGTGFCESDSLLWINDKAKYFIISTNKLDYLSFQDGVALARGFQVNPEYAVKYAERDIERAIEKNRKIIREHESNVKK